MCRSNRDTPKFKRDHLAFAAMERGQYPADCRTIPIQERGRSDRGPGQTETSAGRFGMSGLPPIADIVRLRAQVRSVPCVDGSGLARPFFTFCSIGRCSHVFGLLMRFTGPLAIMPSADQVPVNKAHSTMRWHEWAVLIAGSTGSALRAVRPPNLHITPDVRRDLVYATSATGCL